MRIILGLGNPGINYEHTRHNVGWIFLDTIATEPFSLKPKLHAAVSETQIDGEKILLVKATQFYNETGITARSIIDFYKLSSEDLLVIHDDLALPLGTIRLRLRGSPAGNNGIKSITAHIGSEQYPRIRIGINKTPRSDDTSFVLGKLSKHDRAQLAHLVPHVRAWVSDFANDNLSVHSVTDIIDVE